ncbi:MAG: 1-acyl-sn-glycerol-3-phosphate acyltransferase [Saprospiraceae bacterium]
MNYRYARQSTGWLYLILAPFVHVVYRLLFRKIYLHNRHGVKPNTPTLIAANHPTAFIDPIFFCIFFDPPVFNMTRGDVFRKPLFRKIMESFNMFPVFRKRDGYQGHDRNDEVFEFCQKKLLDRVVINVFVEGEHHLDKRVLPPQKGIARIAFGAYERSRQEDLQIVPVGCNYINGALVRDEAKIIVGKPIYIKDYWPLYEQNPNIAINQLCQEIHTALKSICYHIDSPEDDALAEKLLMLWRNDHPANLLPVVEHQTARFWGEKKVLDHINSLEPGKKISLKQRVDDYFNKLDISGLSDEGLVQLKYGKADLLLFLIITAPLAFLGFTLSWPLRWFVASITKRVAKKPEYYTSIFMGLTLFIGGFYVLGLMITGLFANISSLVTLAWLLPLLTWLYKFWTESLFRWISAKKSEYHPDRKKLLALRAAIWN